MSHASPVRTGAALDADELARRRDHYEHALDRANRERAEDYALYMQTSNANSTEFAAGYDARVYEIEDNLARAQKVLDQHLSDCRKTLATDEIWGPKLAEIEAAEAARAANTARGVQSSGNWR